MLSDGTPAETFAGYEWIEQWDKRKGYCVFQSEEIPGLVFSKATVTPVFIEEPAMVGKGRAMPGRVAFRETDLPSAVNGALSHPCYAFTDEQLCDLAMRDQRRIWYARLSEWHDHSLPIGVRDLRPGAVFLPREPLTRQEWATFGYHLFTRDAATTHRVVPLVEPTSQFSFPADSTELAAERGVLIVPRAAVKGSGHLIPSGFTVTNPTAAGAYVPWLAHYPAGAEVTVYGLEHPPESIEVPERNVAAVEVPHVSGIAPAWMRGEFVILIRPADLRATGRAAIWVSSAQWPNDSRERILATPELLRTQLVEAREASAKYMNLHLAGAPALVVVPGHEIRHKYYFAANLKDLPAPANKRKAVAERKARIMADFGGLPPEGWEEMDEGDIADHLEIRAAQKKGWRSLGCVMVDLGLAEEDDFVDEIVEEQLLLWLEEVDWPMAYCLSTTDRVVKPIKFKDIVAHPQFARFFELLVDGAKLFVLRVMFDDKLRRSILRGA